MDKHAGGGGVSHQGGMRGAHTHDINTQTHKLYAQTASTQKYYLQTPKVTLSGLWH